MSAITLKKIIVILIIAVMGTSAFIGFANNTSAQDAGPKTRAAPEPFFATSNINGEIYYYPFSGGSFQTREFLGDFYSGSGNMYGIAAGDFDGDSDFDILYYNQFPPNLNFYLLKKIGPGAKFDTPTFIGSTRGSIAMDISVGDVNNDKRLDFVTSTWQSSIVLFLNQGSDTFTSTTIYNTNNVIGGKELVDFDCDGHLDLVGFFHWGNPNLYWMKGDGKGNFGNEMLVGPGSLNIYSMTGGDFDLNGYGEGVFAGFTAPPAWYTYEYTGSMGNHQFGSYINYYPTSTGYKSMGQYDYTGDGYPDLVSQSWFGRAQWAKNNGHGSFYDLQDIDTNSYSNLGSVGVPSVLPADNDDDYFPDYWETRVGLNPSNPNEDNFDPDNDGLTNREEFEAGSHPYKKDTDDDGVDDFWEVQYTTDPNNPDSDFDGASDYDELYTFNTAPWTADSDAGGMIDGVETHNFFNTDPKWNPDDPIQITDTTTHSGNWFDHPDAATDSKHNTHIAFCRRYNNDLHEIRYMMVDPASNILIQETTITNYDGFSSYRPQIAVDSNDKVHITWTDVRFGGRIGIYYIKLDPYRDDRNGNAASLPNIRFFPEKMVSNDFSDINWQQTVHRMTIDSQDQIDILMPNAGTIGTYPPGIYFIQLNSVGNPTMSPPQMWIWNRYEPYMSEDLAVDSNDNIHVTFNTKNEKFLTNTIFDMDEGSGTVLNDGSGNNNNAILGGDGTGTDLPTWTTGKTGGGLEFINDANDDDYAMIYPYDIPSREITVEFWMRSSDSTKAGTPISYAYTNALNNEFLIYDYRNFAIYVENANIVTGVSANDGQWHHIAVTWRSSDGQVILYKDGAEAFRGVIRQGGYLNSGGSLAIGQEQDRVNDPLFHQTSQAFIGTMDQVAIYAGALPAGVIYDHYMGMPTYETRGGTYYMMLDGGDGSKMIDGTQISPAIPNGGQEIAVDSKDKVHIVWHQEGVRAVTVPNICGIESSGAQVVDDVSEINDDKAAEFTGDAIIAEWTNLPANQKTLTLVSNVVGAFTPFDVYVWDGSGWMSVSSGTSTLSGYTFAVNLNPYLPDGAGKIRVRYEPLGVDEINLDFCGFKLENWIFPVVEVYYTKLDPSLDDRDGSASTDSQLTLIQDMRESKYDGVMSMWPTIAIDGMDRVHIPWYENSGWTSQEADKQDLVYIIQDEEAQRLTPEIPITPTFSYYAGATYYGDIYPTFPYISTDMLDHSHIVWCDIRNGYNINHAWMNPDDDNDRLPLKGEYQYGTDPMDPDSDDDDLIDGAEVYDWGTDPMDPDSDDDLLKDGVEVLEQNTDPLDKDTDDGGVPDGEEVLLFFTDPLDPSDDTRSNNYFQVIDSSLEANIENNNGDTTGWTRQNLWHLAQNGQTSLNTIHNIIPRGQYAWWYAQESTGTFNTGGTTWGSLITPTFTAPTSSKNVFFTYWSIWAIESEAPSSYDSMEIYILSNGGSTRMRVFTLNPEFDPPFGSGEFIPYSSGTGVGGKPMWIFYAVDITDYAGQDIRIEFYFDSGDDYSNDFLGWVVDDFRLATVNPPGEEAPEEPEVAGINIVVGIDIPGSPNPHGSSSAKPSDYVYKPEDISYGKKEEAVEITTLDLFLIFFIILLAATLATSLQYQKKKAEALLKARCVSGQQTRLLDINDQMKEAMDIKKTRRIRPGNLVEIIDVKGNTIEIATEIGSFFVPSDMLSCAEGVEEIDVERSKQKQREEIGKRIAK